MTLTCADCAHAYIVVPGSSSRECPQCEYPATGILPELTGLVLSDPIWCAGCESEYVAAAGQLCRLCIAIEAHNDARDEARRDNDPDWRRCGCGAGIRAPFSNCPNCIYR